MATWCCPEMVRCKPIAFVVWPLPSRRCYCETEKEQSERSRGRERPVSSSHNALHLQDLCWNDFFRPSGASAVDRHTGRTIGYNTLNGRMIEIILDSLFYVCFIRFQNCLIADYSVFSTNKSWICKDKKFSSSCQHSLQREAFYAAFSDVLHSVFWLCGERLFNICRLVSACYT